MFGFVAFLLSFEQRESCHIVKDLASVGKFVDKYGLQEEVKSAEVEEVLQTAQAVLKVATIVSIEALLIKALMTSVKESAQAIVRSQLAAITDGKVSIEQSDIQVALLNHAQSLL